MKQKCFFLAVLFVLILPVTAHTQVKVTAIDSLIIELLPDYDRASILVLLTGALPVDTTLPATVTLPIPATAQLNAVARIDDNDGQMKDDIISSPVSDGLSFTTPNLRFRLEYYLPYAVSNNRHTFNFSWMAAVSVNKFKLKIQRPLFASRLTSEPASINVFRGEDGFTYYSFPEQFLPAGQSFSVRVDYTMSTDQLSAEGLAPLSSRQQEPGFPSTAKTGANFSWPFLAVVAGALIIILVFVWRIAVRRNESKRSIPQRVTDQKASNSKFCSNCDNPVDIDDRFCSNCGAGL